MDQKNIHTILTFDDKKKLHTGVYSCLFLFFLIVSFGGADVYCIRLFKWTSRKIPLNLPVEKAGVFIKSPLADAENQNPPPREVNENNILLFYLMF